MLTIRLLGAVDIRLDNNQHADLGSRKAIALLIYLVMEGKPVARDTVTALLWPEMAEAAAKNNMRTTLTRLKRHLGSYLEITPARVAFNYHLPHIVDVKILQSRLATALSGQDLQELQQAIDLYQGEFLQGFHLRDVEPFEEWLLQQRERLHLLLTRALETLVRLSLERGEYTAGLQAGRRLLTIEPWLESAHRHVMQMLALSGERAKALQHYEHCCRLLATELGVKPAAETLDLYTQIQAGGLSLAARPQHVVSASPPLQQETTVDKVAMPSTIPHNLHSPLTAFIGRQKELAFITQHLCDSDCRLLTIVGLGGMGKTSLALEVGQHLLQSHSADFPNGIFFVPLASIAPSDSSPTNRGNERTNPGAPLSDAPSADNPSGISLVRAVANQIGCQLYPGQPPVHQLQSYLRKRALLLILDNFEHLLPESNVVVSLLNAAPSVNALVTSRVRLNLRGERVLTLNKLSLPPPLDSGAVATAHEERWRESEAIAMFVQRTQALTPTFTINNETITPVVQICRLLDGLPLGIELATSMLPMVSCAELAAELTQSLGFLSADTHDLPHEQRTLYAVFMRSWHLLSAEEQTLLAQLSFFPATFTLTAAQSVASATAPLLMRLVDHSLLSRAETSNTVDSQVESRRYVMHPSVREFARKKLQERNVDEPALEERYTSFYLALVAQREGEIHSPEWQAAQIALLSDIDNIRLALRVAIRKNMWQEIRAAFTVFNNFFADQGWFAEALNFCQTAGEHLSIHIASAPQTEEHTLSILLGRLLTLQGWYQVRTGKAAMAHTAFQRSLSVLRDTVRAAEADPQIDVEQILRIKDTLGSCLTLFGTSEHWHGKTIAALQLLREALPFCRKTGDKLFLLHGLTMVTHRLGDYPQAQRYGQSGLELAHQVDDKRFISFMMTELGRVKQAIGDYGAAQRLFQACYELRTDLGDHVGTIFTKVDLAETARIQGDFATADAYLQSGLTIAKDVEFVAARSQLLWALGNLALDQREYAAANAHFLESRRQPGFHQLSVGLPTMGWALMGLGEFEQAAMYYQEVLQDAWSTKAYRNLLEGLGGLLVLLACIDGDEQLTDKFAAIETHPATTEETSTRVRRMYAEIVNRTLPAERTVYRPTPIIYQIVEEVMTNVIA